MCLKHSCEVHVWKKYYLPLVSGSPLHICPTAMRLIILGIPIQDAPRRQDSNKGLCFLQAPPLSRLVFLWLSYSEGLGPPPKQSRPCTKDYLGDFSHKLLTTQLTTQSIFYLSVGGWEFMVKALNAQLALVTMEPYPQNSLRLRHAILLSAAEMRRSFWLSLLWSAQVALWKEGDGERKGGVRVQTKGSHWDSLSVIKFVETQKELQSHSREHLEREIGGL